VFTCIIGYTVAKVEVLPNHEALGDKGLWPLGFMLMQTYTEQNPVVRGPSANEGEFSSAMGNCGGTFLQSRPIS
jgi:hypothetical protein